MLNRADKDAIIKDLREDINNAGAFFVTNLIGIKSVDAVAIRKQVRDAGGKLVVTRNTLFAKAAVGTKAEKLLGSLKGPHAVAFAFGEAPAVAKCLKEAGKTHELVDLKSGFFGDEELSVAKIKMLADLPSREEMLGTLLATFNAPISALARVLNAIREEKEKGGGVVQA
jgi:large subunit ribosomal protein L10